MERGTITGYRIVRRTFEAAKHAPGSALRDWHNLHWSTSEYMPSYRYGIADDQNRCVRQFRTKRETVAYLAQLQIDA